MSVATNVDFRLDPEFMHLQRPLEEDEQKHLDRLLKRHGCFEDALIVADVADDRFLIDGHNTLERCRVLGIKTSKPRVIIFKSRDEARLWVFEKQLARRNLQPQDRLNYVKILSEAGHSNGAIAEMTGTSKPTVARDLEKLARQKGEKDTSVASAPGVTNVTPGEKKGERMSQEKVKGKDGKTYPKKDKRRQAVLDHFAGRKTKSKSPAASEEQQPEDDSAEAVMKTVNAKIEGFCRKVMSLVESECPTDAWLSDLHRRDSAIQKFKDACSTLRTAKCSAICPMCKGEACARCRKTGRVPKMTYDQLV